MTESPENTPKQAQNGHKTNGKSPSMRPGRGGNIPPIETRWKPGQSGNPLGRSRGPRITAALKRLIEEGLEGRDLADSMAKVAVKKALKGDIRFFELILNRLEGKVDDTLNLNAQIGSDLTYDESKEIKQALKSILARSQ